MQSRTSRRKFLVAASGSVPFLAGCTGILNSEDEPREQAVLGSILTRNHHDQPHHVTFGVADPDELIFLGSVDVAASGEEGEDILVEGPWQETEAYLELFVALDAEFPDPPPMENEEATSRFDLGLGVGGCIGARVDINEWGSPEVISLSDDEYC